MPALNWGQIQDGGILESMMHALLYAEDPQIILFGRPGKDAGQDARTADGTIVYQSKYRNGMDMDEAVKLALEELEAIKKYRATDHVNYKHWKDAKQWVLFANLSINPNDDAKWKEKVVPEFAKEGLAAGYWTKESIEGKLAQQSQVREVYFGQENRVLVSLKEAHDLLKNERLGSDSLDSQMLGRDADLVRVNEFVNSTDKRVLPVIGPGGIGKSRFLYESLVVLAQDGWRVLWGLPGAMAKSSQWFRLLNGTQKTCVALDDPDNPALIRAVIEQLSTVERSNWRVIASCRTDRSDVLRQYRTNKSVEGALRLAPLSEADSKSMIRSRLGGNADEAWLHQVFRLTQGNPGWLSLLAELARQKKLVDFPQNADGIADLYLTACLEKFDGSTSNHAHILLRWLALWGSLVIETRSDEGDDFKFLEAEGIPKSTLQGLLRSLTESGLIRNWGIGKRLYGIDSLLIRQHILSEWLLRKGEAGEYFVSSEGTKLVSRLISSDLPHIEATLQTISQLSLSRLESREAYSLLRPIFGAMVEAARNSLLIEQKRLAELVVKLGNADPESALNVLIAIRENLQGDQIIDDPFWGKFSITQSSLISTLSWTLFTLAESVGDSGVAHFFLSEFRALDQLVESGKSLSDPGKHPRKLLHRLLCESRNSGVFAQPAFEIATQNLLAGDWWPFVGDLAKCILEPKRETTRWVANWTLGFSSGAITTDSPDWRRLLTLRKKLFEILQTEANRALHNRIWPILADSHHSLRYVNAHYRVSELDRLAYRNVLINDLTTCQNLLRTPRTLNEATFARPMWEWYLKYSQDEALVAPSQECERLYSALSKWRLHDFFRFDYDKSRQAEVERVANDLRSAIDPGEFNNFFDEVDSYLSSARGKSGDMADSGQLGALADKLSGLFSLDASGNQTALSSFVLSVLAAGDKANKYSSTFAVMVCQAELLRIKSDDKAIVATWLSRLLEVSDVNAKILYRLYEGSHPKWTGPLSIGEWQCVLTRKADFSNHEWLWLIGVFAATVDETLMGQVVESLKSSRDDRFEASNGLRLFIRSAQLAFFRYEQRPSQTFVQSILDWIVTFQLDGTILESHDLEEMIKRSGIVLDIRYFASLMQSRVDLERLPKQREQFKILPYDFNISEWCKFDSTNQSEVEEFHKVCQLALVHSFTARYRIPKYLSEIDPSGNCVASFVTDYLAKHEEATSDSLSRLAYLASPYPVDSEAWAVIASPICSKANILARRDREYIYFCLSQKETGAMSSMPGEVNDYYIRSRDSAKMMLDQEPQASSLRPFREWALQAAEHELRHEEERAEEERANG